MHALRLKTLFNTFQWNPTGDNAGSGATNAIFCIGNVRKSMNFQAATGYKAGTTLGTMRLEGSTSGPHEPRNPQRHGLRAMR
jgi:hypothetical protein